MRNVIINLNLNLDKILVKINVTIHKTSLITF